MMLAFMLTTSVLIVGAGPTGLSLALGLTRLNVPCMLIEKRACGNPHPRARGIHRRTMELFRLWGNDDYLKKFELSKQAFRFIWVESLQGIEIGEVRIPEQQVNVSPIEASLVSQDFVEDSLYHRLQQLNPEANVRFAVTYLSYEEQPDGVTVKVFNQNTQQEEFIKAQYLIAADGAHSLLRRQAEIAMQGPDNLGLYCSIYAEFDIGQWTNHRPNLAFFFTNEKFSNKFLLSVDNKNRWIISVRLAPGEERQDFTPAHCLALIRELAQTPDLVINILDINFWKMGAQVAANYRKGRLFLIGDAAHRLPPTGGFGMNTGIQDAHNLAWKLAYVLNHLAPESLLESYEEERAPIARQNIDWSTHNSKIIVKQISSLKQGDMDAFRECLAEQQEKHMNALGLDLGFIYHSNFILSETNASLSVSPSQYIPTAQPGARAPHCWLKRNQQTISTLDLFEKSFVFLIGAEGQEWEKTLQAILPNITTPIIFYRIATDTIITDPSNTWHELYEISTKGIVLVRPDGHVAWRTSTLSEEPHSVLTQVIDKVTGG